MEGITYAYHGDYLLPEIKLKEQLSKLAEPICKYGAKRRSYLKTHQTILYNTLLLSEQLFPHLLEVQQEAQERQDSIISDILMFNPPPDKSVDNLAWAAHMGEVRRIAEKILLDEVVYY